MTMRSSIQAAQISGPQTESDGQSVCEFRFAADDPVFAGHFPGNPILPGVFQLELTRLMAEAVLKCRLTVREISKAKFRLPVSPGETVRVELKLTEKDGAIHGRAIFFVGVQSAGETILVLGRTRTHFDAAPVFSLSSPEGGEGRGEEAKWSQTQIPSPQPSPRLGGEREPGTSSKYAPHST